MIRARFVYLVEAENGMVKIGSSDRPVCRARLIASGNAAKTRLISFFRGDRADERALHKRFDDFRTWGEWFEVVGDLREYVESRRGLGVTHIPDWTAISREARIARQKDEARRVGIKVKARWSDPERRKIWQAALIHGRTSARASRIRASIRPAPAPAEASP